MLNRIKKALFSDAANKTAVRPQSDLKLASAALLVEAAVMDGTFDDTERTTVTALLKSRFELSDSDTAELIADAEEAVNNSNELYTLTRTIKNEFNPEQRIEMIEMLWEVVYADGVLDDYEANLVRRLNGLLHVSDRDSGEARKRVIAKLGL
ncbi:MAG: TerB family tellurite resistance protein [Magnetovibrio sp.]|nr:TerB family tellurite resistance protein [Magnetovibrio sp.]